MIAIDYDGNERRGLTAKCRREDGSEYVMAISEVVLPQASTGARYIAAYRRWLKHGAKWRPTERYQINDARRSLLKMSVDYTVEFVWIMNKYDGCSRDTIEQLLRTPTIKRHVAKHQPRIQELLKDFGET